MSRINARVLGAKYRRNCLYCRDAFTYHPSAKDAGREDVRGLFCSMACKSKSIADSKPGPHTKIRYQDCATCSKTFVSHRPRVYCTEACILVCVSPPMDRVCRLCGTQYVAANTGGKHKQYCSEQCKKIVGRAEKAARRAKVRKATVEQVDPYAVFARDGWRCQLCGIATPEAKRGSTAPDAPELDHVQPIAKGGAHSYANTQCACRRCNGCKSDKIVSRKYYFDATTCI